MDHRQSKDQVSNLTRCLPRPDTSGDKNVIDSIEPVFFSEQDFDANEYELKKLADIDVLCVDDVDRARLKLKNQLLVVSKKISALILDKASSYSNQMEEVQGISNELKNVIHDVRTVRSYLGECKRKSAYGLRVLSVDRKKRVLLSLKENLTLLKTLHDTEYKIHELLEEGKFPLAIHVCVEAMSAAEEYAHLSCVNQLSDKLRMSSDGLETALQSSLSSLLNVFDADRYLLVYNAYRILDKVEDASNSLVTMACAALERRARQVVTADALLADSTLDTDVIPFEKLCELITSDRMADSLQQLAFSLCQVLGNVHAILTVHAEEEEREKMLAAHVESAGSGLVSRALSSSLYTIFRTALVRFTSLLSAVPFTQLPFDDVLKVIRVAATMRQFGRRHFGHSSVEISRSLEKQSALFFLRYHQEKMDELRMFVENEAFAVCPLPEDFTLSQLQEFSFLREFEDGEASTSHADELCGEENGQLEYALISPHAPNPFSTESTAVLPSPLTRSARSSTASSNGRSSSCDKGRPNGNSNGGKAEDVSPRQVPPNLCNAALVVLRLLGGYIRMTSLFHCIADRSIPSITQLFHYFLYAIVNFFARDGTELCERMPAPLAEAMADIERELFHDTAIPLLPPSLSPIVQLNDSSTMFAFAERIVAVQSVEFLAHQLKLTRSVMESLIPQGQSNTLTRLHTFYDRTLTCVQHVRVAVLSVLASRVLKLPTLVSTICSTQWNVSELQSKHSTYIDFLLQDLEVFSLRFSHQCLELPHVHPSLKSLLWEKVVNIALRAIVHGYGQIGGRCTNEGRALMQLDIQHLAGRLEKMVDRKVNEEISYVDAYIKAYYLPEKQMEEWATTHTEYTVEELTALLNSAVHVSKKTRTRIIQTISRNAVSSS